MNEWERQTEAERRALEAEDRMAMMMLAAFAAVDWALWWYVCAAG